MNSILVSKSLQAKPNIYSVSRLKKYVECSEYFKLYYVDKIRLDSFTESTIIGNLVHEALELFYKKKRSLTLIQCFLKILKKTLVKVKLIKTLTREIERIVDRIIDYCYINISLEFRSSDKYECYSPIRRKDGQVASNPSMTRAWKDTIEFYELDKKQEELDTTIKQHIPETSISVVKVITEAFQLCFSYVHPEEYLEPISLEFPISLYNIDTKEFINPVKIPIPNEEIYLTGFIDRLGYVKYKGKKRLSVVDYKTSRQDFTNSQVKYNVQLHAYAYAYEQLTGSTVEVIGIHNLRSGTLILEELKPAIHKAALDSLFSSHYLIEGSHFYKHMPDNPYSHCLSQYGKACPYLNICHPEYE